MWEKGNSGWEICKCTKKKRAQVKLSKCAHFQDAVKRGAECEGAGSDPAVGRSHAAAFRPRGGGKDKDRGGGGQDFDSCGLVGGAGCCLRRERQGSDLCESVSAPRTRHPKPKPKPSNSTSVLSIHIPQCLATSKKLWLLIGSVILRQGGKRSCQNEGGKTLEPINNNSAQPCGGCGYLGSIPKVRVERER